MSGYIGPAPVPQATQTRQTFTATSGQTSFATIGYVAGGQFIQVYLNGVLLKLTDDYTAANGSDIVLTSGAATGDILEFITFADFTVNNQNFTGNLTVDTDTLYVDSTNNRVGVGTVDPTYGSLEVRQSVNADENGISVRSVAGTRAMRLWVDETTSYIGSGDTGQFKLVLNEGLGPVGIGNTAPTHNLHVTDTDTPNLVIETTALSGQDAKLRIRGSRTTSVDGDLAQILFETNDEDAAGGNLAFITAGKDVASTNKGVIRFGTTTTNGGSPSEHMRINSDGQVVIEKLVANGSSRQIEGYESGNASISTGTSAGSYLTYSQASADTVYIVTQTINFANAFSGPPKVFVYQYDGNASGHGSIMRFWADNVTSSGFTLITSDTSGSGSVGVNWIAIRDTAS